VHGVAGGCLGGVDPGWWDGPGPAVSHLDAPSCPLVVVMVVVAEQGQIAYR
jgi:hypothetical protein